MLDPSAIATLERQRASRYGLMTRPPTEAAVQGPVLWRAVVDYHSALALERRLRPCARKLEQEPFLFFGFGLASPKQGLLGVLPELIGF